MVCKETFSFFKSQIGIFGTQNEGKQNTILTLSTITERERERERERENNEKNEKIKLWVNYHRTPLVRWSPHKYKCLWSVGGKG